MSQSIKYYFWQSIMLICLSLGSIYLWWDIYVPPTVNTIQWSHETIVLPWFLYFGFNRYWLDLIGGTFLLVGLFSLYKEINLLNKEWAFRIQPSIVLLGIILSTVLLIAYALRITQLPEVAIIIAGFSVLIFVAQFLNSITSSPTETDSFKHKPFSSSLVSAVVHSTTFLSVSTSVIFGILINGWAGLFVLTIGVSICLLSELTIYGAYHLKSLPGRLSFKKA